MRNDVMQIIIKRMPRPFVGKKTNQNSAQKHE